MENNKMRFKMYKSGKNWMVAGLMTTAVLAGITLSNVNNDVVAHAATEPATTATTTTPASSSVNTSATADQISKVQGEVSGVNSANEVNKGFQDTTDANQAHDQNNAVSKNLSDADVALSDAKGVQSQANTDASAASESANKAAKNLSDAQAAKNTADQNYNEAVNDPAVKYVHAKDADNAAQSAADKAQQKATSAANAANAVKSAASDAVAKAQRQYEREISGYRHNPTHENAVRVSEAKTALDAAKHTLANMNNYDALVNAKKDDQAKQSALEDANAAVVNDNNEYNQEAQAAAQSDYDRAEEALAQAKSNFANDNADIANYVSAKDAADKAQEDADSAADAVSKLHSTADDVKSAAQSTLDNAKHQLQREYSAYRHNKTHENALRVIAANDAVKAAQKALDDMNNYDSYVDALKDDQAKTKALQDAQEAVVNDNSEYNQEAEALAQRELNDADNKLASAKSKVADLLNHANNLDALKAAKDAADQKFADAQKGSEQASTDLENAKTNVKNANDLVAAAQAAKDSAVEIAKHGSYYIKHNNTNPGGNTNPGNTDKPGEAVKPGNGSAVNGGNASVKGSDAEVANASIISASAVSANSNKAANQNAKLAQTGNSDSAAVVALGALSAMLGLGMVAKKREF